MEIRNLIVGQNRKFGIFAAYFVSISVVFATFANGAEKNESGEKPSGSTASTQKLVTLSLARYALLVRQVTQIEPFQSLFDSVIGDTITIPVDPSVDVVVSSIHETGEGVKTLTGALVGFSDANFALTLEPTGALKGHILSERENPALIFSSEAGSDEVVIESTESSGVICIRNGESENEFGHEPEPIEEPEPASGGGGSGEQVSASVPVLNSKEGAVRVIYLDFDGEVVENTWWNNGARIDAQPYAQQGNISGIWQTIAEDFAPFDVNVTTSRAVFDGTASNLRSMVIFTPTNDAAPGAGGVAYLNTFGHSVTYMCWVFNSGLNGAAEAGSHEAGHQLGLSHDGTSSHFYYSGHRHAATNIQWGPIMGASYSRDITQWSKGNYSDADNTENDLSLIINYLPYRADDHSNNTLLATEVADDGSGSFSSIGMIERASDVDYFKIQTGQEGPITITANPSSSYRNLDIRLSILDSSGSILTSQDPQGGFGASAGLGSVSPGTYYIVVEGVGLGATGFSENGYDDYGSIGGFTLSGTFPTGAVPPAPTGVSASDGGFLSSGISVQWNSVPEADGYEVYRSPTSDTENAVSLGSTASRFFTDNTASPGEIYYYTVRALSGNGKSGFSSPDTGYTGSLVLRAPDGVTASDSNSTEHVRVSWLESPYASAYYIYRNTADTAGGSLLGTTSDLVFFDATAAAETIYFYSIAATNGTRTSERSARDSGARAADLSPPAAPANVVASKGESENFIVVRWDSSEGAEFYRVYRGESPNPNESALSTSGPGTGDTVFYDTGAQSGRSYYYFIQAANAAGSSEYSVGDYGFKASSIAGDDNYEINDTLAEAHDLQSGEERWLRTLAGYGMAGNDDWFRVQLGPGESRVEVIVNFPASSGDIDLGVYDDGGILLAESASATPVETLAIETGKPGSVLYLRVFPKSGSAGRYDLKWKSQPAGQIGNLADMTIGETFASQGGADIYSANGGGQTIISRKKGKKKHSASLSVENEGAVGAGVIVYGSASNRKFEIKYFQGESNVTGAVNTGRALSFQPLEKQFLTVSASPKSRKKDRNHKAIIWTRSNIGSNAPDTVTMNLKSKRSREKR